MDNTLDPTLLIIAGSIFFLFLLLLVLLNLALLLQIRNSNQNHTGTASELQKLNHAVQLTQVQTEALNDKVSFLQPVSQTVGSLQSEVRGLTERISTVETSQSQVQQGVGFLANSTVSSFSELKTLTNSLSEATTAMRSELSRARTDLTELHARTVQGQQTERQVADSIRRLETIIAGTHSKGAAGENILELVFSQLPAEWQVRDFRVGGKPVEFGLRLPNHLVLPIDSKWAATHLLEQFTATEMVEEQLQIKRQIEEAVLARAREVRKYIDPSLTVNFGVAVVPDAVYELCGGIQAEIFRLNVVLVSYSMFIPYLLLVFQTMLKAGQSLDLQHLDAYLQSAQDHLTILQEELDGRFSKALTMLTNSRDELRTHLSKLSGSLVGLQISASRPESQAENLE
jgi:DNA recombination protein RmuC